VNGSHTNKHTDTNKWKNKTHKHRWTDVCHESWAYTPTDVKTSTLKEAFNSFCKECNIDFKGEFRALPGRQMTLFESLASRSNLNIRNGEIYKDIELKQIGEAIFDVIMASKAIGDLIFSSRAYEPALFVEEVASFLKERRVRFKPKVSVQGATGKKYKVDFKIFNHRISYLQTLSPVSKAGIKRKVDATFRMWYDFDGQFQKASLLNDIDFVWPESDIILLQRVSRVIPWSKKEKILELTK